MHLPEDPCPVQISSSDGSEPQAGSAGILSICHYAYAGLRAVDAFEERRGQACLSNRLVLALDTSSRTSLGAILEGVAVAAQVRYYPPVSVFADACPRRDGCRRLLAARAGPVN